MVITTTSVGFILLGLGLGLCGSQFFKNFSELRMGDKPPTTRPEPQCYTFLSPIFYGQDFIKKN